MEENFDAIIPLDDNKSEQFKFGVQLERGGFSAVYPVIEKSSDKQYVIKSIWLKDQEMHLILREVEINIKLASQFTVEFISAWRYFSQNEEFVSIQMELCPGNLKNILTTKHQIFKREKNDPLSLLEWYLSSKLLYEIVECLDYFHSLEPNPVIHRDLKPANILFCHGQNGRFLKLCDFGLSKEYLRSTNTTGLGTFGYMAWEVRKSDHYNLKADIFSLAVIALELFGYTFTYTVKNLNCEKLLERYLGTTLEDKVKYSLETLQSCISIDIHYSKRPNCKEFITMMKDWMIDEEFVRNDKNFQLNMEEINNSGNEFIINYARAKFNLF